MIAHWNIESMTGYKPITTFWQDFSIADGFGASAVEDTYRRACEEWKTDYKYEGCKRRIYLKLLPLHRVAAARGDCRAVSAQGRQDHGVRRSLSAPLRGQAGSPAPFRPGQCDGYRIASARSVCG